MLQRTKRSTYWPHFITKAFLLLGPLLGAFGVLQWSQTHSTQVEDYARNLYPLWAVPLSRFSALFPFSLSEALLYLLLLWVGSGLLYACVRVIMQRRIHALASWLWQTGCIASLLISFFAVSWGIHYDRQPIEVTLQIQVEPAPVYELDMLCGQLIQMANRLRMPDENMEWTPRAVLQQVDDAYQKARERWHFLPNGTWGNPKLVMASEVLSRMLIEGVYSPFTAESQINGAIPGYTLPFTACHEAAHQRGFAREEEANLIAFLVCMASEIPAYQYSAAMGAMQYALPALAEADSVRYAARMTEITAAVVADMQARNVFWATYRGKPVAKVAAQYNHAYLQVATREEAGIRSYGRLVDLLLAMKRLQIPWT